MTEHREPRPLGRSQNRSNTGNHLKLFVFLLLCGALLFTGAWVAADSGWATQGAPRVALTSDETPTPLPTPYLYLDPQVREIGSGDTGVVAIRTSYVENLYGVQVNLHWNPALLEVVDTNPLVDGVQIEPGDVFTGHNIFRPSHGNEADNIAGELMYALSIAAEPTGVTGEFTVARITFRAKSGGSSTLVFTDTYMVNQDALILSTAAVDGEARVVEATSTPTLTPTPSGTPTQTRTPTNTPIPTVPVATATATEQPEPTEVITCRELIQNGGFETQSAGQALPWVFTSSSATDFLTSAFVHGGTTSLRLGGYNNADDSAYQLVTVPQGAFSATLSFWWLMDTRETTHPHDFLHVDIRNAQGDLITTLHIYDDGAEPLLWSSASFDMTDYEGETVRVLFRGMTNASGITSFYIDDVSLDACVRGEWPPITTPTPTPTITRTPTPTTHHVRLPIVWRNVQR
jgi:hypothetical protein